MTEDVNPLPESGKFAFEAWAAKIGVEPRALKENIDRNKVRTLRFGRTVFIDAEWFWADLAKAK